jgi:hypothetical protein
MHRRQLNDFGPWLAEHLLVANALAQTVCAVTGLSFVHTFSPRAWSAVLPVS